jgi:hypothetical protein
MSLVQMILKSRAVLVTAIEVELHRITNKPLHRRLCIPEIYGRFSQPRILLPHCVKLHLCSAIRHSWDVRVITLRRHCRVFIIYEREQRINFVRC